MSLLEDIRGALNHHSAENVSNTPDFILAQYIQGCLAAFDQAVQQRENWFGRDPRPSASYEVGYKRPPKHTRFKKGHSGNPKGRPKGTGGTGALVKVRVAVRQR